MEDEEPSEYADEADDEDKEEQLLDYNHIENVREQRKEVFDALDGDLATLEQLKEQKNLLKSIRLRKEELKALEGRRKALEALRKIANDSELQLGQAFQSNKMKTSSSVGTFGVDEKKKPATMTSFVEYENETNESQKLKQVSDLSELLRNLNAMKFFI